MLASLPHQATVLVVVNVLDVVVNVLDVVVDVDDDVGRCVIQPELLPDTEDPSVFKAMNVAPPCAWLSIIEVLYTVPSIQFQVA